MAMCVARRMPVVVILGATGAGKSKLALEIAQKFHGEIISADSMQVYKSLDIITNKVTPEEQALAPHHMLDFVSPLTRNYTVMEYRRKTLPIMDRLLHDNKMPVVVGGTNYYIESLLWKLVLDNDKGVSQDSSAEFQKHPTGGTTVQCNEDDAAGSTAKKPRMENDDKQMENEVNTQDEYPEETTSDLYERLTQVDPESAQRIHPHNRRKIIRALVVHARLGRSMTEALREQQEEGAVSGPLLYPDTCMIWVKCQQDVLDARIDARVDDMIQRGLVKELTDFHKHHIENSQNKCADYTLGIFQSIGFKEFHEYLRLNEEQRETPGGHVLLKTGVEDLKRVTRRYSRQQDKWIRNRFLKRRGSQVPDVYTVDSTKPEDWATVCFQPAVRIVDAFIKGTKPDIEPEKREENENTNVYNRCDVCNLVFVNLQPWQEHMKGRKHKKRLESLRKAEKAQNKATTEGSEKNGELSQGQIDLEQVAKTVNPENSDEKTANPEDSGEAQPVVDSTDMLREDQPSEHTSV